MIRYAVAIFIIARASGSRYWSAPALKSGNTVTVDVFGEAQCIHTTAFLRQQLLPAYKLFGSRLRIRYHPFGVTKYTKCEWSDGHTECYCQHGPRECEKNALQACVMSYLPNTDDHLELVSCIQGGAQFDDTVTSCISDQALKSKVHVDWLVHCARSDAGRNLMSHYGRVQSQIEPKVTWVPWVLINGVREREAERSLQKVLCTRYLKPRPSACAAYGIGLKDQN